jgi:hypothetical protein
LIKGVVLMQPGPFPEIIPDIPHPWDPEEPDDDE